MLNAKDTQFTLKDTGEIFYQANETNPVPGVAVARIKKGQTALQPDVDILDSSLPADQDKAAVREHLTAWLGRHIATVLEPLVKLDEETESLPGPVKGICFQVYESMGITPRENLEELIAGLDQDMRRILRAKRVRLGPVLVFIPDLNKPAGVHLRALLWNLNRDLPLPADVPNDGIVSFAVDPKAVNPDFYQAIGYPVYGSRAIRIDMLDRVISAVYEQAEKGRFKAEHKMAEWLGCGIEDLYAVLQAMGHRKIHDPAAEAEKAAEPPESEKPDEALKKQEKAAEEKPAEEAGATETGPEVKKPQEQRKPELATFALKKGKAFEKRMPAGKKKPVKKQKGGKKDPKRKDRSPRVISTGPKPKAEDSPFAILEQLKDKKDAS